MEKSRIVIIVVLFLLAAFFVFGKGNVLGFLNKADNTKLIGPESNKPAVSEPQPQKDIEAPDKEESNDKEAVQPEQPQNIDRGGAAIGNGGSSQSSSQSSTDKNIPLKVGSASVNAGSASRVDLEG